MRSRRLRSGDIRRTLKLKGGCAPLRFGFSKTFNLQIPGLSMATNLSKIIIVLVAIIIGFLMLRQFIGALVLAGTLVYVLWPYHKKIAEKTSKNISAYILTAIVTALVISIVFVGASVLLNQVAKSYIYVSRTSLEHIEFNNPETTEAVKNGIRLVFSKVINWLSDALSSVPNLLLSVFVFIISFFYLLKDGEALAAWVKKIVPLADDRKSEILSEITKYVNAFVIVWLLIGLLQAIVAGVGFYIFGIPYPLVGAIVAALLSILPVVGPGAMYIPIGAFLFLSGNQTSGIGLIVYGLTLGGLLDYIIRPYLAGQRSEVHPLVILLGILGGLTLLGAAGMIVGPILLITVISILKNTQFKISK